MNVIFFSPHFPPHYYRFCHHLKAAGANVLGIGDEPYDQLAPVVRDSLTEYYRLPDMNDYDALVRACGYFTHKYGKIGRFESLNEFWLNTEARIRDDFNIAGIRSAEIDNVRRKSRMKEIFSSAGVPVARGKIVRTEAEARDLIAETGFPVIVKPDAGVGALDTFQLESLEDLASFFRNKPPVDYIMEEFIRGTIYSFDGLADRSSEPLFCTSHVFSQGIMETVNQDRHIYYYSLRDIPPTLEKLGRQCLKAFNVRERFFHIEFFKTDTDTYVGLEVNMRPPGGYTTDMFNYACDIDIYRAWAHLLTYGQVDLNWERKYFCCYASRKKHLRYLQSHNVLMARYGTTFLQVCQVPGIFSSALGDVGYIFRSPNLEEIQAVIRYIHAIER
jgi:hypothetical protein